MSFQLGWPLCFENSTRFFFHSAWHRHCFWKTCYVHENIDSLYVFEFWVTDMSREVSMQMFSSITENKRFERAKVNSRSVPLASGRHVGVLRRAPTWRLHTNHYNFQWYPMPNNSSSEYRTFPKFWHVVYYSSSIFQFQVESIYWVVRA